jgi:hypothetical protein
VKWQLNETELDKMYNDYRSLNASMGLEIKVEVEAEKLP